MLFQKILGLWRPRIQEFKNPRKKHETLKPNTYNIYIYIYIYIYTKKKTESSVCLSNNAKECVNCGIGFFEPCWIHFPTVPSLPKTFKGQPIFDTCVDPIPDGGGHVRSEKKGRGRFLFFFCFF